MVHYSQFEGIAQRFMQYARIDTQSDPSSNTTPSTPGQLELAKLLVEELKRIGIADVELDEFGYIYAGLPSNSPKVNVPTICFCAHMDTAPDCSGNGVKPRLHANYQGQSIGFPDDDELFISPEEYPQLLDKIGHDIITASGLTLLGADDKAGIACIMSAVEYLMRHPDIRHGNIRILFTPDEEIGRGVDKIDMVKLNADYGYTLDSGDVGLIEDETFSADAVEILITGVSTHPGYAKGKMENAAKIAGEILAALPKENLIPEATSGREGFVHPTKIEGSLEQARIEFIVRDFETTQLLQYEAYLEKLVKRIIQNYPQSRFTFRVRHQYRNMKEVLVNHPQVVAYAIAAMREAEIAPKLGIIRGGTDGSRLSFMGLPCPNLFAGQHAIHSRKEWTSVQDMQKAAELIVRLCQKWEEHGETN